MSRYTTGYEVFNDTNTRNAPPPYSPYHMTSPFDEQIQGYSQPQIVPIQTTIHVPQTGSFDRSPECCCCCCSCPLWTGLILILLVSNAWFLICSWLMKPINQIDLNRRLMNPYYPCELFYWKTQILLIMFLWIKHCEKFVSIRRSNNVTSYSSHLGFLNYLDSDDNTQTMIIPLNIALCIL